MLTFGGGARAYSARAEILRLSRYGGHRPRPDRFRSVEPTLHARRATWQASVRRPTPAGLPVAVRSQQSHGPVGRRCSVVKVRAQPPRRPRERRSPGRFGCVRNTSTETGQPGKNGRSVWLIVQMNYRTPVLAAVWLGGRAARPKAHACARKRILAHRPVRLFSSTAVLVSADL